MKTRRLKADFIRPAGVADDYEAAERTERLNPENPVDPAEVAGDANEELARAFARRGKVKRVVRRPHVEHYLGQNLDLIAEELKKLKEKQANGGLSDTDMQRMKDCNEMMARIFREEREQVKLDRFEDLSDEDIDAQILAEAQKIAAGED